MIPFIVNDWMWRTRVSSLSSFCEHLTSSAYIGIYRLIRARLSPNCRRHRRCHLLPLNPNLLYTCNQPP